MPNAEIAIPGYAPIDASGMARKKSVFVPDGFSGRLILQASNDDVNWADAALFTTGDPSVKLDFLCKSLRIGASDRRNNYNAPLSIWISAAVGPSPATVYTTLTVPETNGRGAVSGDLSALGPAKSILVAGSFQGTVLVEGIVQDVPEVVATFIGPGVQHVTGTFDKMQVRRVGNDTQGSPSVSVASAFEGGSAVILDHEERIAALEEGGGEQEGDLVLMDGIRSNGGIRTGSRGDNLNVRVATVEDFDEQYSYTASGAGVGKTLTGNDMGGGPLIIGGLTIDVDEVVAITMMSGGAASRKNKGFYRMVSQSIEDVSGWQLVRLEGYDTTAAWVAANQQYFTIAEGSEAGAKYKISLNDPALQLDVTLQPAFELYQGDVELYGNGDTSKFPGPVEILGVRIVPGFHMSINAPFNLTGYGTDVHKAWIGEDGTSGMHPTLGPASYNKLGYVVPTAGTLRHIRLRGTTGLEFDTMELWVLKNGSVELTLPVVYGTNVYAEDSLVFAAGDILNFVLSLVGPQGGMTNSGFVAVSAFLG